MSKTNMTADKDQLLADFRMMSLIRRFEEKAGQLYGMGHIGGFCHLYIGQEAVVTGLEGLRQDGDQVVTGYRDHGHMLACGMDPKGVMAELTGREGGYSKGKGGSMHMFSKDKEFYGGHGIVGAQVPIGAGLAFANKYRGNDGRRLHLLRRRRVEPRSGVRGHEHGRALGPAGRLRDREQPVRDGHEREARQRRDAPATSAVPASASPARRSTAWTSSPCARRPAKRSSTRAAAGGRTFLEMKTYRYRGHSMSDPAKYRTRDEVDEYRKKSDPIERIKDRIVEGDFASEDELKEIDKEQKAIVKDAADFALESPEPDADELWTDVYAEAS